MSSLNRRLRRLTKLPRFWTKRFMVGMLRALMIANRPDRLGRAGFVLPTTVLLLLVVSLSAGALTYRAFSRSDQAIALREQKVITNAATPAIDRAKAKIEYLFQRDDRIPGGLPSSDILAALMIAPGVDLDKDGSTAVNYGVRSRGEDIYSLPDETRMDINGDGDVDNAWFFPADINGDGVTDSNEVIAYSVLIDHSVDGNGDGDTIDPEDISVQSPVSQTKADALVTRTGPIGSSELGSQCRAARSPEGGWQVVNGSRDLLQKNFQVDAFVLNRDAGSDINRTVQTLEFQQSREAARGSKWGAWFRYDLEVFPAPEFKWNGAMHSASNMFVQDNFKGYMVSSNESCIYSATASEITLGQEADDPGTTDINETFQGQFVRGSSKTNDFTRGSNTPEFHFANGTGTAYPRVGGAGLQLNDNNAGESARDSVSAAGSATPTVQDISANPITLYTQGVSKAIDESTWQRDTAWASSAAVTNERIYNKRERRPYVDDFFRADNRWGPKPEIKTYNIRQLNAADSNIKIGANINGYGDLVSDDGLDGYWERQAIKSGLRLIVGQRLELGNTFGWNVDPRPSSSGGPIAGGAPVPAAGDALYPPIAPAGSTAAHPTVPGNSAAQKKYPGGIHEVIQRKSLRDNLSAVQAMAVYHYETNGNFPRACIALTAHPGTNQTILDSRTFGSFTSGNVKTNFLEGKGTNGWEFRFPANFDSETDFASEIASTASLGIALRNLAAFAGDPKGGAPSFVPVQDGDIHPHPYLSMWGDFSPLRRIFEEYLDAGTPVTYARLSPADKSTLHTAACTVGMLAYQLDENLTEYANILKGDATEPALAGIDQAAIASLVSAGNIPVAASDSSLPWLTNYQTATGATAADIELLRSAIERVRLGNQIVRDRALGFKQGYAPDIVRGALTDTVDSLVWNPTTGAITGLAETPACDPNIFNDLAPGNDTARVNLALAVCGQAEDIANLNANSVKYPALYYLFPLFNHDHDGDVDTGDPAIVLDHLQPAAGPAAEAYITNTYIQTVNPLGPTGKIYAVVGTTPLSGISDLKLTPGAVTLADWVLPQASAADLLTDPDDPAQAFRINLPGGTTAGDIGFLDKGMFDGREQINSRILDINVSLLTSDTNDTDTWITDDETRNAEGIVYAFREDAVREDEIVRPKSAAATAATCSALDASTTPKQFALEGSDCYMSVNPGVLIQDPPLTEIGISLKPVDYYPDPERRPYGFRFRNGADVSNGKTRDSGITFVTDNAVYVLGDFNLHSSTGTTAGLLEEFTDTLSNKATWGPADFYANGGAGRTTGKINTANFANLTVDYWRPVEILADSVGILSANFKDGNVSDTFVTPTPASASGNGSGTYSYQNQNRPYFETNNVYTADRWVQENEQTGAAEDLAAGGPERNKLRTPVWIDRNGKYYLDAAAPSSIPGWSIAEFLSFGNDVLHKRNLIQAAPTYMNATIVSGLVPNRPNQAYGGFHNFPHFNEHWGSDVPLYISGAFLQLDFSTAATAPFDPDAWERDERPVAAEFNYYYEPPARRWGYDVGLQYVPPAPVSRRFVTYGSPRSEYYREVPVSDPYMMLLRCATYDDNGQPVRIDPSAQCPA